MKEGKTGDFSGMTWLDRQNSEIVSFHFTTDEEVQRFGQAILSEANLDADLPLARRTQ